MNTPTSAPDLQTQILQDKPLPIILRMATPNALAFLIQAGVSMTEVWYVGQLGTISLAAMAFVFPGLMLMQMLSGGAIGGAVASAIARSLGGGQTDRARALVWHALAIAAMAGASFLLLFYLFGRPLLELLGAQGAVLEEAMGYASIIFTGSISLWTTALMSGVFRGMGNMRFPAMLMAGGGLLQVVLSGTLVLGWFGVPSLGIYGAAISVVSVASLTAVIAITTLCLSNTPVQLSLGALNFQQSLFVDIFRVGALASLSPVLTVSSIMVVNGLISDFGAATVAGYGIGSRLEFLLIPMVFGFGAAMNTMVGMNVGAGNVPRAERIAFVGGSAAGAITGLVGITLALWPQIWIGLFTDDPATLSAGATYLQYSGWAFAFQGIGLSLYFASQGAGTVVWPVIANFARFGVGAGGAAVCVLVFNQPVTAVFICLALGMALFGIITAASIRLGVWRRPPR